MLDCGPSTKVNRVPQKLKCLKENDNACSQKLKN